MARRGRSGESLGDNKRERHYLKQIWQHSYSLIGCCNAKKVKKPHWLESSIVYTWWGAKSLAGRGAAPWLCSHLALCLLSDLHPRLDSHFVLLSVSIIFCCWLTVWRLRRGDVDFHTHFTRLGLCCCQPLCLWVTGWSRGGRGRSTGLRNQRSGGGEVTLGVVSRAFSSSRCFFLFLELLFLKATLLLTKLSSAVLEPDLTDKQRAEVGMKTKRKITMDNFEKWQFVLANHWLIFKMLSIFPVLYHL